MVKISSIGTWDMKFDPGNFFAAIVAFFLCGIHILSAFGVYDVKGGMVFFKRILAQHVYQFFLKLCQGDLCHLSPLTIPGSSNTPAPIWENRKAASATESHLLPHIEWRRKHHISRFFWVLFFSSHFPDLVV